MTDRSVLVTGAAGFVGRHTLAPLARLGFSIHAIGRRRPDVAVHSFHAADLADRARVREVLRAVRPTHLLHCAWYVVPDHFWSAEENRDWVTITADLAQAALEAGLTRFVGVGSCAEYDWSDGGALPRRESDPLGADTLYGESKLTTFRNLQNLFASSEVAFAWARLFHLFGAGQPDGRLVPALAQALLAGREAAMGPGQYERDFMDVADAGEDLAALVASGLRGAVNVASGTSVTVDEVGTAIGLLTGRPDLLRRDARAPRHGDPPVMRADVTRLREGTALRARRPFMESLARCVEALPRPR